MSRQTSCFFFIPYIIGLLVIQDLLADDIKLKDRSTSNAVYAIANDSATDGARHRNDSRFSLRPPPYAVKDAGAKAVFECAVNDIYADYTVKWQTPAQTEPKHLKNMTSLDIVLGGGTSDIFITHNDTLVFQRLEKRHVGLYSCVIHDADGSRVAVADMRLYVIDISGINYARKTLYGICGAALMSLVIFALYLVMHRRKKASTKRTPTTLEMDASQENAEECLDRILPGSANNGK